MIPSTSPTFLQGLPVWEEIRSNLRDKIFIISEIKSSDRSPPAAQKAKGLNPVSMEGNSKLRGNSNVWNEGQKIKQIITGSKGRRNEAWH